MLNFRSLSSINISCFGCIIFTWFQMIFKAYIYLYISIYGEAYINIFEDFKDPKTWVRVKFDQQFLVQLVHILITCFSVSSLKPINKYSRQCRQHDICLQTNLPFSDKGALIILRLFVSRLNAIELST